MAGRAGSGGSGGGSEAADLARPSSQLRAPATAAPVTSDLASTLPSVPSPVAEAYRLNTAERSYRYATEDIAAQPPPPMPSTPALLATRAPRSSAYTEPARPRERRRRPRRNDGRSEDEEEDDSRGDTAEESDRRYSASRRSSRRRRASSPSRSVRIDMPLDRGGGGGYASSSASVDKTIYIPLEFSLRDGLTLLEEFLFIGFLAVVAYASINTSANYTPTYDEAIIFCVHAAMIAAHHLHAFGLSLAIIGDILAGIIISIRWNTTPEPQWEVIVKIVVVIALFLLQVARVVGVYLTPGWNRVVRPPDYH